MAKCALELIEVSMSEMLASPSPHEHDASSEAQGVSSPVTSLPTFYFPVACGSFAHRAVRTARGCARVPMKLQETLVRIILRTPSM